MQGTIHRYIIEDQRHVPPFNEPASELTVGIKPLKIYHEEFFTEFFQQDLPLANTLDSRDELPSVRGTALVFRDNHWFDAEFFDYFFKRAKKINRPCRAAIPADDPAFRTYTIPLTTVHSAAEEGSIERATDKDGRVIYLLDLWYFPNGYTPEIVPVVVPSDAKEKGFFSVPDFMTMEQGDLTHFLPARSLMVIESWVHVYYASIIFSNFARASRFDERAATQNFFSLKLLWNAVLEQRQILSTSTAVKVGKGTVIHPTAVITGPTVIGENVTINPGVVIDNCTIGDNVTIDTGCVLMMSTVANNCFLPFRASLFFTAVMESTIIAQNTCLQMCVIGRNSFVGAGSTFTDFNLLAQKPIFAANIKGELQDIGQIVMGSAVGHNCRVGSGMVVYPGRMIESDVVLVATPERRVIMRSIDFDESDHHYIAGGELHKRFYPRREEEGANDTWE
jgi:carbonic anhydrase/acetyltransferase-like protein (isoleucine patch superfamily)